MSADLEFAVTGLDWDKLADLGRKALEPHLKSELDTRAIACGVETQTGGLIVAVYQRDDLDDSSLRSMAEKIARVLIRHGLVKKGGLKINLSTEPHLPKLPEDLPWVFGA